jgi:hypothetical protein
MSSTDKATMICVVTALLMLAVVLVSLVWLHNATNVNNNAAHIREIARCVRLNNPTAALSCVNAVLIGAP